MKCLKMRAEMTPKERIVHWALDTVKFITLLASIPFILAAYAWPMVVGAVIAHQLRSRGGEILVGFFVFVLFNRKLCKPAAGWFIEHVGDFHAWLDRFDPAICSDDDPAESETPPAPAAPLRVPAKPELVVKNKPIITEKQEDANMDQQNKAPDPASVLDKWLEKAREEALEKEAQANHEKEEQATREKEGQAAYEKAMQAERERSAKWIADNMDEIKAFARSTEKRDAAALKRTRIVAVVLAVLLVASLAGNLFQRSAQRELQDEYDHTAAAYDIMERRALTYYAFYKAAKDKMSDTRFKEAKEEAEEHLTIDTVWSVSPKW